MIKLQRMKLQSLNKDYKLFANIVIIGAIVTSILVLLTSYNEFNKNSKLAVTTTANNIDKQIKESLSYVENIANFIGNQITEFDSFKNKENVASILFNTKPKIDQKSHDIFTWTLFDFINDQNQVVVSSSQGILSKPINITKDQRSWIEYSRQTPWRLLPSKPDTGLISKEKIIPCGFGLMSSKGKFIGIISAGINVQKLQKKLESIPNEKYLNFIILGDDNSTITNSNNLSWDKTRSIVTNFNKLDPREGFFYIGSEEFYYKTNQDYGLKIIIGVDSKAFLSQLRWLFIPKILNTLYLTIFFLVLLYFFRSRLLKPITELANAAEKISYGNYNTTIPQSDISEVKLLAKSIEEVRGFLKDEEVFKQNLKTSKESAEIANQNKTEFLSSTAHELKNMLTGIIGMSSLLKGALKEINTHNADEQNKKDESINWASDLVKLGEECAIFVNDILDINQAQSGDFKIEEVMFVDIQDATLRSIRLMKTLALKKNTSISTTIRQDDDKKFIAHRLDPRRVKQIITNIISNAIKYSPKNSKISVNLYRLNPEENSHISKTIETNVRENNALDKDRRSKLLSLIKTKRNAGEMCICVEVSDHGYGMNDEEIKIAMTKYGTINHNISDKVDSTGLGIPIVKHLVESQGGLLEINSKKGEGTTVRIIF